MLQPYVLLVEDHRDIAEMVGAHLESKGYVIDYATDGPSGLQLGITNVYDAIVLDVMLPGMDGLEVCSSLREKSDIDVPILMLTARDTLSDKLSGFEHGTDDYLVKPFELEELEARLISLVRRHKRIISNRTLAVAGIVLDIETRQTTRDDIELNLTPIGLKILELLMRASPRIVQRIDIEREVWGETAPDSDALRSHMYTLRKTVDKPFSKTLIHTIHGAGFRLADDDGG